ncbi:AAA family ATPase [Draconibacterium sp. IB214405]|uniref:AAA family ATPase n=1 Tax=Draconibacterium sp. IB214405 TaxID=3097352 RepID=UPI002A0E5378|nr:AAA family ATPase [Draconibacterium sp. IB214405]MDX8339870.1 AAA family ATPase [Draconibacterium sp. IB214405]
MIFKEFTIKENIHKGADTEVFRAERKADNKPVLLKVRLETASVKLINGLAYEFEIGKSIKGSSIVKYLEIKHGSRSSLLVMEDDKMTALQRYIPKNGFELSRFLTLAIAITKAVEDVHSQGVIIKDINPSNIIVNPKLDTVKLIDFGLAVKINQEQVGIIPPTVLPGTLAYISPEQTGRINKTVDLRSDLYSLGVTLYKMISGVLPFTTTDKAELIFSHIAKKPRPVIDIKEGVPEVVSAIIMKLLDKNPNERYQSASGLLADLLECKQQLDEKGKIESFELSQKDFTGQLYIPEKLYGRETELHTLLQTFDRVSTGKAEMMLVAGYSGVGKTALVHEVHKPMTEKNGHFAAGKFDQFQKNIPYYAITLAFNEFCRYLLMESAEQLEIWRKKILAAVGKNGQIIIDVIPDLEFIIGKQPPVAEVGATEEQNRFNVIFLNFIKVLSDEQHPFILFIDDLQWADTASLNLLKSIMLDDEIRHLLIIGAYRDNEVDSKHSLIITLHELQQKKAILNRIELKNLHKEDISELLKESFAGDKKKVQPLTNLVYEKTRGNAFFTHQFVHNLYDKKLLKFNFDCFCWQWDTAQIAAQNITDNVVEMMADKIKDLPPEISNLLQLASAIGNTFNLKTLTIVSHGDAPNCSENQQLLLNAIREGLILPLNDKYKAVGISDVDTELVAFKFLHDRVQQAAYSLIADNEKPRIHLKIGRLMFDNYNGHEEFEDKLFDLVNHFNQGQALVENDKEKLQVARLNLQAGVKAGKSMAYSAAEKYLETAYALLPENAFDNSFKLAFEVCKELARSYYINNDFEKAAKLYPVLHENTKSVQDEVEVFAIQMDDLHLQGDYESALNMQKAALELLGVKVGNDDELEEQIKYELTQISVNLKGREIEELTDSPEMDSEQFTAQLKILVGMWMTAYLLSRDTIVQWSSVKMTNLCLQHGNSDLASFAYIQYGFVCINRLQDFKTGYKFGEVALVLSDRYENLDIRGKVYFMFGLVISHWQKHVRYSTYAFRKAYKYSVEAGDWTYAGYGAANIISNLLIDGNPTEEIYREAKHYLDYLQNKSAEALSSFFIPGAFCALLNLMGKTKDKSTFDCEVFSEAEHLTKYYDQVIVLGWFYVVKMRSLYWYGLFEEGAELIGETDTVAKGVPGQVKVPEAYFYSCLMLIAADEHIKNTAQKEDYYQLFEKYHAQLKIWAENSPQNYEHKYLLIEAERLRAKGENISVTLPLYEAAIQSAHKYRYPNNEALGHELLAKMWLERGNENYAANHLSIAKDIYKASGATAKIDTQYEKFQGIMTERTNTEVIMLDLDSVITVSQTISGEIKLNLLLEKIMNIVLENAGAERAVLLLPKDDEWYIEGEKNIPKDELEVLHSIPFKGNDRLPANIIRYVARTKENIVLNDAAKDGIFVTDKYIVNKQLKSILCTPLMHKNQLKGILYLENNLVTNAFRKEHVQFLSLLAGQAAISIENAILYGNSVLAEKEMQQKNEEIAAQNEEYEALNEQLNQINAELQHSMNKLTESERKFKSIVTSLPLGFQMFTIIDEKLILTDTNKVADDILKKDNKKLIGKEISDAHPNLKNTEIPRQYFEIARNGGYLHNEEVVLKGVSIVFENYNFQVMDDVMVSMFVDITERKKLQDDLNNHKNNLEQLVKIRTETIEQINEELRESNEGLLSSNEQIREQREELKNTLSRLQETQAQLVQAEKMASLGTLTAGVSHEINNPLNYLSGIYYGFVNYFEEHGTQDENTTNLLLSSTETAIHRISDIVKGLNQFSRDNSNFNEDCEVHSILDNCLTVLYNQYKNKVEIVKEYCPEVNSVRGNVGKLHQVFTNILMNGIQAIENKGQIFIKTCCSKEQVTIELTDTGSGISKENLQKITDPFFTTKDPGQGTGLGLSITYSIIQDHNGTIDFESEINKGTKVKITLPLKS